jgi:hypothetical protein
VRAGGALGAFAGEPLGVELFGVELLGIELLPSGAEDSAACVDAVAGGETSRGVLTPAVGAVFITGGV